LKGVVAQNLFSASIKRDAFRFGIIVLSTAIANFSREAKRTKIPGMIQVGKKSATAARRRDHGARPHETHRAGEAYDKALDKKKFRAFLTLPLTTTNKLSYAPH